MERTKAIPLLIIVVTLLVMGRVAGNEFVPWDDSHTLYENPRMNPPTLKTFVRYAVEVRKPEGDIYIPLTQFVWAGLALFARTSSPDALGGTLNSMIFHLASVVFHALGALAVWAFIRRVIKYWEGEDPAEPSRQSRDGSAGASS